MSNNVFEYPTDLDIVPDKVVNV